MLPNVADDPPYRPGQDYIAKFQLVGNQVHVFSARVEGIERRGDGWRITDQDAQQHDVPNSGISGEVTPLDDFLRHELKTKGEGFVVVESLVDMEQELPEPQLIEPQELPKQSLEQQLNQELGGGGRDGI